MATRTKEELLATYKKASKPARLVIIGKAGFTTEKEYFDYLDSLEIKEPKKKGLADFFGKKNKVKESGGLDQVIAFDTTGSMRSYIGAVREHVRDLIPKIFAENPDVRMKIVAFGDYCDMKSPTEFGNAYQETELTNDQAALIRFVDTAQNTSGGDGDEFYELVIKKIVEETKWREGSKRAVLLISDADPHVVGYTYHTNVINNQIDWKKEAEKSAKLGIAWDTLTCTNAYVETFYKPLSKMTNGVSIPFHSSEKTQHIVHAVTASRGGTFANKRELLKSYTSARFSGDDELVGSYKSLTTLDADFAASMDLMEGEVARGISLEAAATSAETFLNARLGATGGETTSKTTTDSSTDKKDK